MDLKNNCAKKIDSVRWGRSRSFMGYFSNNIYDDSIKRGHRERSQRDHVSHSPDDNILRDNGGSVFDQYIQSIHRAVANALARQKSSLVKVFHGDLPAIGAKMRLIAHTVAFCYCCLMSGLSGALSIFFAYMNTIAVSSFLRHKAEQSSHYLRPLKPSMEAMKLFTIAAYIRIFYPQSDTLVIFLYGASALRLLLANFCSNETIPQYISGLVASEVFAKMLHLICSGGSSCCAILNLYKSGKTIEVAVPPAHEWDDF